MTDPRVFVLGSGFSRYAGMLLVRDLRTDIFDWIERNKDGDSRIRPFMYPMKNWPEFPNGKFRAGLDLVDSGQGFEELLIDLQRSEDQYPVTVQTTHVLRRACVRLLWEKQRLVSLSEPYRNFARHLEDSYGAISFNWDLVCEYSVDQTGIAWSYDPAFRRPILKPHGSINWVNHLQGRGGVETQSPDGIVPIATGMTISWEPANRFDDPLYKYDRDDFRQVLFPGDPEMPSKEEQNARRDALQIWRAAERSLEKAEEIIFIGYSLPAYDSYASKILGRGSAGKRAIICNPDPQAIERFRQALEAAEVIPMPIYFADSPYARPIA